TATTFSMSMPLLSAAVNKVTGIPNNKILSVMILLLVALIYTIVAFIGMKGLAKLANISVVLFLTLLIYVFLFSGEQRFIIENGISSIGNLVNNFVSISTDTDPLRKYTFIQNWTVYYWSYWMVWCVATPFFIGKISKGRTIKNVILGGYSWGLAGTYLSFIIMSGYGLSRQFTGKNDFIKMLENGNDYASIIISIFKTIPLSNIGLLLLVLAMVGLYSTVFDSITMVFSAYSYKNLARDQEPDKKIRVFWAIVFIILPIALISTGNSVYNLQSVSIIAAFPIGMIMIMIVGSFLKEIKNNHK
ncbi:MAG TPA: BCCT family transporter, partial [Candidatus Coprovivens excrementavium]|nr:BCCT family transporter [Candidatus Coprovivens excrementavium]